MGTPTHDGRVLVIARGKEVRDGEDLDPRAVAHVVADFYETIGGQAFFTELAERFYALVAEDDVLSPLFSKQDWAAQARGLTAHFVRIYGRNDLTAAWDPQLHRQHSRCVITRAQRLRWLELMSRAGHSLAPPQEQLDEFLAIMKIASGEMMAVSRGAALARNEDFHWDGSPR